MVTRDIFVTFEFMDSNVFGVFVFITIFILGMELSESCWGKVKELAGLSCRFQGSI